MASGFYFDSFFDGVVTGEAEFDLVIARLQIVNAERGGAAFFAAEGAYGIGGNGLYGNGTRFRIQSDVSLGTGIRMQGDFLLF